MKFDLSNIYDLKNADSYFFHLKREKKEIEIKPLSCSRTALQNRALHKFFVMISDQLNELGVEFCYTGLKDLELSAMYTPTIVKEFFWRPIQKTLFNIDSTKDLDTNMINDISDVIIKFFSSKGVVVEFPRKKEN